MDRGRVIAAHLAVAAAAGPGAGVARIGEQRDASVDTLALEVRAHRAQDHVEQCGVRRSDAQGWLEGG